jgi:hypothetical protein
MRDPELVARAERGARRLESAWEKWRAQHGLAVAPGQPIVSYVGYSLTEPWGEPRVVIGIDADEAEYLADFLDREDGAQVQLPRQQAASAAPPVSPSAAPPVSPAEGSAEYPAAPLVGTSAPVGQPAPVSMPVPVGQPAPVSMPVPVGQPAPVGIGRQLQSLDQGQEMATEPPAWSPGELASQTTWSQGERADQVAEQLAGWQGGSAATNQPPSTP